jgi:hypothetical protein
MGFKAWFELLYKSKELLRDLYQPGLKRDRYFKMKRDFWALSFKRAGSKPNSYPVQTEVIFYMKKKDLSDWSQNQKKVTEEGTTSR